MGQHTLGSLGSCFGAEASTADAPQGHPRYRCQVGDAVEGGRRLGVSGHPNVDHRPSPGRQQLGNRLTAFNLFAA